MQKADKIVLKYLGIYMFLTIKGKGSHTFEGEQGRGYIKRVGGREEKGKNVIIS